MSTQSGRTARVCRELRQAVAERDGWRCRFCGRPVIAPPVGRGHTADEAQMLATLDHWVPRTRGGGWELSNLVLACRPCNNDKGSLTGDEYLTVLAYRRHRARRCPLRPGMPDTCRTGRPSSGHVRRTVHGPSVPLSGMPSGPDKGADR